MLVCQVCFYLWLALCFQYFAGTRGEGGIGSEAEVPPGLKRATCAWLLRPDASAVAIGAVHGGQIAEVNRVLENLGWQRGDLRPTFLLIHHRMAGVAIFADDFAILADVIAIVAAEAALIIEMANVVGMGLPVYLHGGKERGAVDALQFDDSSFDAVHLGRCDLRILVLVELCNRGGNRVLRLVRGLVISRQHRDALLLDKRQGSIDGAPAHRLVHGSIGRHVDVRGAVVAVDAVHAALLGLVNLGLGEGGVLRHVLGHPAILVLYAHPGNHLALLVAGKVGDLVGDVHVPVDTFTGLPEFGIAATDLYQHAEHARRVLLIDAVMSEGFELRPPEFPRPVALLAGLLRGAKILHRGRNGTRIGT